MAEATIALQSACDPTVKGRGDEQPEPRDHCVVICHITVLVDPDVLLGGGQQVQDEVRKVQAQVFAAADKQITEWGIEHNDRGERAEAYVYCVEVKPEGCDYFIPLAPSWIVDEYSKDVVRWRRLASADFLAPEVITVTEAELALYKGKKGATVVDTCATLSAKATGASANSSSSCSNGLQH